MKPPALQQGDTVRIVAPASAIKQEAILKMKQYLEQLGLIVTFGNHLFNKRGYLAGSDSERLEDLQNAILDPHVKAIFCARGGYGSARLLPYLDVSPLKWRPKIFWGYSDITFLHTIILQQAHTITFHGPMIQECGTEDVHPLTLTSLQQLFSPTSITLRARDNDYPSFSQAIRAPLIGGNLTLLVSTLGTPYEIETNGRILLLEDVGEEPYVIDRLLNQLRLSGKLYGCAGIILADFHECHPKKGNHSLSISQVVKDHILPFNIPLLSGFPIGHCSPNYGIPLGGYAVMNGIEQTLLIEPGVKE